MRAALYLRVSTDDQTTENQRRDLEAAATLAGWMARAFVATFPGPPAGGLVDAHVGVSWAEVH